MHASNIRQGIGPIRPSIEDNLRPTGKLYIRSLLVLQKFT